MKKHIIIALLLLSVSTVFAQHEKIKALKTAHITTELNLSSSEAEKFWPVYNASQKKNHELRKQLRGIHKKLDHTFDTISEKEALSILNTTMDLDRKIHEEKNALTQKLKSILSAKKIIQLQKAEDQFKRKLIKKFKDRRSPSDRTLNRR
jgi:hypothetical protein